MGLRIENPWFWIALFLLLGAIEVILTLVGVRYSRKRLIDAPGADRPQTRDGANYYAIKDRFRNLGLLGAPLMGAFFLWMWFDARPAFDWLDFSMAVFFFVTGPWMAWGHVTTDDIGIAKNVCGFSRRFAWSEITDVEFRPMEFPSMVLRTPHRRLVMDARYEAFDFLAREIEDRTARLREKPPDSIRFWTA